MITTLELPVPLSAKVANLTLRRASDDDLGAIMRLLSDDPISASRGDRADEADTAAYRSALTELVADTSNEVLVVADLPCVSGLLAEIM